MVEIGLMHSNCFKLKIHWYTLPEGIRCTLLIRILRAEEQVRSPVKGKFTNLLRHAASGGFLLEQR